MKITEKYSNNIIIIFRHKDKLIIKRGGGWNDFRSKKIKNLIRSIRRNDYTFPIDNYLSIIYRTNVNGNIIWRG